MRRVAGAITTAPRAIASRTVSGLSPTSTIRARPRRSRWVSGRRAARSVDTLPIPAPVRFAQLVLRDLPGPGLREGLPKLHRARHLETRQAAPAVRDDLFRRHPLPRLEHDQGLRGLPHRSSGTAITEHSNTAGWA